MTEIWKYLIYLYGCGAAETVPEPPKEALDWSALLKLADSQSVNGVIACALRNAPFCPPEIRMQCRQTTIRIALKNEGRMTAVMKILKQLEANKLHPAVLKGYDLARLYAIPECRSSADTDLFIPKNEEKAAEAVFRELGCSVEPRTKRNHHGRILHESAGIIELHAKLWSDNTAQALFGENAERFLQPTVFRRVPFRDGELSVLKPFDALIFLAGHLVRHFIEPSVGIRQVYDFALFFAKHKAEVDADAFWQQMREYRFDGFLCAALSLMIDCGCFSESDFPGLMPCPEKVWLPLLRDMELYSAKEKTPRTKMTWEYFCTHRKALTKASVFRLTGLRLADRFRIIFPKASHLENKCTYLKGRHWLYPAAWVHRCFAALFDRNRRQEAAQSLSFSPTGLQDSPASRIELMKTVGLLK